MGNKNRIIIILLSALGLAICFLFLNNLFVNNNRAKLPTVLAERNGQSVNIIFAGYKAGSPDMSILPLSDGSYLVGAIFCAGASNGRVTDPYPAFFRFDENWNLIEEVPFDAEDFLNGSQFEEAVRDYDNIANAHDVSKYARYKFETNSIKERGYIDGQLSALHTDSGIISQSVDLNTYTFSNNRLYKCYYYDFEAHGVKLASIPELDKIFTESDYFFNVPSGDALLLYGSFYGGFENGHSYAVLLRGPDVIWTKSGDHSEGLGQEVFWGNDKCLLIRDRYASMGGGCEFSLMFSDGREQSFPLVNLPDGLRALDIQACHVSGREPSLRLDILFKGDRRLSLGSDGTWEAAEPFSRNNLPREKHEYQFFVSKFTLDRTDRDLPGTAVYKGHFTSVWNRWSSTGDYKEKLMFRGVCLEVVYGPTEKYRLSFPERYIFGD